MKQISPLMISILISLYSLAQPKTNYVILGGDVGLEYVSNGTNKSKNAETDFTLNFLPSIGVFVSKNIALGLNGGIEYHKAVFYQDFQETQSPYSPYSYSVTMEVTEREKVTVIVPFVSLYHFFNETTGIKNNFTIGAGFGSGVEMYNGSAGTNGDYDIFKFMTGYELKFLFLPTKKMALNIALVGVDYIHQNEKHYDITNTTDHVVLNSLFSNSVSIGIEFYLGGETPAGNK